ncbi:MAG: AmpG family muropeptide MFS transporter [Azospirillaceae bacterium]|nr:AmpG family muropeptide MFS transporter [Azospirillaceae bacterium]
MPLTTTNRHPWLSAAAVYFDRPVLTVLLLGFSSGLPLALTGATLSVWLAGDGISKTAIGLFALVGLPYTFKFVWAPLIDHLPLPFLTRRWGRRRGWALATQLALAAALVGLGATDPRQDLWWTAVLSLVVAFCSASQDIVIDAYRVETLAGNRQGAGAGAIVLGYRLGMMASGAGALYLASVFSWSTTYGVMALLVGVGAITMLANPEPSAPQPASRGPVRDGSEHRSARRRLLADWLYRAVEAPFVQFISRPGWPAILLFITLYKFGEVLAGAMSNPFYLELGFTKVDIATVSKVFGLVATIAGGLLGGIVVNRLGIWRSLLVCGILQLASNGLYILLAYTGRDLAVLTLSITVENLTAGMATAAFVAYLSSLCHAAYTATQYALLSSFFGLGRGVLGSCSGWFADRLDWSSYFALTIVAGLPGLALLLWLRRRDATETDNPRS